jgi:hypothetical protein
MSRPYTPGGRFDTDFETSEIHDAISKDLTSPVGTSIQWFVWNSAATDVDPIYDVGSNYLTSTTGTQVTTTMTGTVGTNTVVVASNTSIAVGMSIVGSGVANGALVRSIAGTTVTLTLNNVGNIAAGTTVTFTSDGRRWKSPVIVPVIKALIKHGTVEHSHEGFYNSDSVHFTIDKEALNKQVPNFLNNPDPINRDRIVWQGQVYRPLLSQFKGIVAENFTLVSLDCRQIMPEEMVNDSQFQQYAI